MEIQEAKIAKANAQDKIVKILRDLESDTKMKVGDLEFRKTDIMEEMGRSVYYEITCHIRMEI
jgi:hypothetical protein